VTAAPGRLRAAAAVALWSTLAVAGAVGAEPLTADQVLELRKAGVSDETIQKMLEQSQGSTSTLPGPLQQQAEATSHIGTWNLPDGTRILSTGKSDLPNHYYDPTINPNQGQNPIQVYPFVGPYGPGPAAAPAPVLVPR
jgi:hypothetical protein